MLHILKAKLEEPNSSTFTEYVSDCEKVSKAVFEEKKEEVESFLEKLFEG